MKVLAIGNSFSQDAMRYLHNIAKADGVDLKAVNLYIGGCPLSRHFINMNNNAAEYAFEFNGENTGIKVSILQAIQSDEWDVITLQQVSYLSVDYQMYQPYLDRLVEYVRYHAPKAKLMIHQTWAYEDGSDKLEKQMGYDTSASMFKDIKDAYYMAAKSVGDAMIIPSGEAMQLLSGCGIEKIHRDTFHADLGVGRYTIGLVWYEMLTGKSSMENQFRDFDIPVSEENVKLAQKCASEAVKKYIG